MPGFRKGKAPEELLLERFGSHVDSEWRELAVQAALVESLLLTGKQIVREVPTLTHKIHSLNATDGGKIHLQFETYPDVPTIAVEKLRAPQI